MTNRRNRIFESDDEEEEKAYDSSDEESIEDEERLIKEEGAGFIDDGEEDEEDDDAPNAHYKKHQKNRNRSDSESEVEDDLSEAEEDLQDEMDELHGVVPKKNRLQRNYDDDEEEEAEEPEEEDRGYTQQAGPDMGSEEEIDEDAEQATYNDDDLTDFIVDSRQKKPKNRNNGEEPNFENDIQRQAYDIFGCDTADLAEVANREDDYDGEEDDVAEDADKTELFSKDDLERGFHTENDEIIRRTDIPERFQLKKLQNEDIADGDKSLELEAAMAFGELFERRFAHQKPEYIKVLTRLLYLIRCRCLEITYIDIHEKDSITEDGVNLSIDEMWQVFDYHLRWLDNNRKVSRMLATVDGCIETGCHGDSAVVEMAEMMRDTVLSVKNDDEAHVVNDCIANCLQTAEPTARAGRMNCRLEKNANLDKLALMFGLEPHKLSVNLDEQYMKFPVRNNEKLPEELAAPFVCRQFPTTETVLAGARAILGLWISKQVSVHRVVDELFRVYGKIDVRPTIGGKSTIDVSHDVYNYKYVTEKPIVEFEDNHDFLLVDQAEKDKLLTTNIHFAREHADVALEKLYSLFSNDECHSAARAWNSQRKLALEVVVGLLIPRTIKKYRKSLIAGSQRRLADQIATTVFNKINVRPYAKENFMDNPRIMGLTYEKDSGAEKTVVAIVDDDGVVHEHMSFKGLISYVKTDKERAAQRSDLERIMRLIQSHQVSVIAITADCRFAQRLQYDITKAIEAADRLRDIGHVNVCLVDAEFAKIYGTSLVGRQLHPLLSAISIQAVGAALSRLDAVAAYSRLMNFDMEIKKIRWHAHMGLVNEHLLMTRIERRFMEVVANAGVDINECVQHPAMVYQLQFVPGLGIRKAKYLIDEIVNRCRQRVDEYEDAYEENTAVCMVNRAELLSEGYVGPNVATNCAAFLRIVGYSQKEGGHILDETRISPMNYADAHKIAIDALDREDELSSQKALRLVIKDPAQLNMLDLDGYAATIYETRNYRAQCLINQIKKELQDPFGDVRPKFAGLTNEELFFILSGECADTFGVGTVAEFTVAKFVHKKPATNELDDAKPKRNEQTGYFICPFCLVDNFAELNDIWHHFEDNCPGKVVGVNLNHDNGVSAFLAVRNICDKFVRNAQELLSVRKVVTGCVTKVDWLKMKVEVSLKDSDLQRSLEDRKSQRDRYYDEEEENREIGREKGQKMKKQSNQTKDEIVFKRVTFHPSFKNMNYGQFQKLAAGYKPGDYIIRPSGKGPNHLTISWKISDDLYSHTDVLEERKGNEFSIGKVLIVESETYEDLDDIITNYLQPMIGYTHEIFHYKYFKNIRAEDTELLSRMISEEKQKNVHRIPYFIVPMYRFPGRYNIVFMPSKTVCTDSFLITNHGYKYRSEVLQNLNLLITNFKMVCQNPQQTHRKRVLQENNDANIQDKRLRY